LQFSNLHLFRLVKHFASNTLHEDSFQIFRSSNVLSLSPNLQELLYSEHGLVHIVQLHADILQEIFIFIFLLCILDFLFSWRNISKDHSIRFAKFFIYYLYLLTFFLSPYKLNSFLMKSSLTSQKKLWSSNPQNHWIQPKFSSSLNYDS
jgi:hypothetical protein